MQGAEGKKEKESYSSLGAISGTLLDCRISLQLPSLPTSFPWVTPPSALSIHSPLLPHQPPSISSASLSPSVSLSTVTGRMDHLEKIFA